MSGKVEERLALLRARMAAEAIDLVVLAPGSHLRWLMGFQPHGDERPSLCVVSGDDVAFLMPALNAEAGREHTDARFFIWADEDGPEEALEDLIDFLKVRTARRMALDETMRADFAGLIGDALPQAARHFSASTLGALRMRKDEDEYRVLKQNALSADVAMQAAWAAMREGMSELEVADVVRGSFAEQGARPQFAIIGAGRNGAFPHHQTGETVLKRGDAVVMDIGGRLAGYVSDITRMAVIGEAPEGYEEVHRVVELAVQAALAAARPGVIAKDVDAAARSVISDAGYGEYFVHRTGHGLGMEGHEQPYVTATSETVLDEGMVFSIEPGIYIPGRFGIRLEDIVILRADRPEVLSDLPRDVKVIGGQDS